MKRYSHSRWLVLVPVLLGLALAMAPQLSRRASAASVAIDHFADNQPASGIKLTQTGVGTASNSKAGTGAIGGERDFQIQITSGAANLSADSNISVASRFTSSLDSSTFGITTLQWDGTAGMAVNPTGLGNQDLTAADTIGGFIVVFTFNDLPIPMTARFYQSATQCSQTTVTTPGGLSSTAIPKVTYIPWANFTTLCPGRASLADPHHVGAVELVLDSSGTDGTDITLDLVEAGNLDFGDNPNSYGTLKASNGPAHYTPATGAIKLGNVIDTEKDGQPNSSATGDNINGVPNDEEGVTAGDANPWTPSSNHTMNVTVSGGNGCLNAWIDWDNNGVFAATGVEKIVTNQAVTAGLNVVNITVPATVGTNRVFYSRWRLTPRHGAGGTSCTETVAPTDTSGFNYFQGEVEDHLLKNGAPTAVGLESFTGRSANGKVTLKWTTGSETNMVGFNVWRRKGKVGSWQKLNTQLIAAKHLGQPTGANYSYSDANVQVGKTYRYKLEVRGSDGSSTASKVIKVTVQ